MDLLKKLFKNKHFDNVNNEKFLKIKASIGQLRININNKKIINAVSFPILLNLICSLSEILDIKFKKLECKRWSKLISEELDDYDFFIAKKVENLPSDKNSDIDNIFKTLKGLRDLFTHYHEYKKTKEDSNKYLLLRTIYWGNSVYVIIVKNFADIQVYKYSEENILQTIKNSLIQAFS